MKKLQLYTLTEIKYRRHYEISWAAAKKKNIYMQNRCLFGNVQIRVGEYLKPGPSRFNQITNTVCHKCHPTNIVLSQFIQIKLKLLVSV